MARVVAAAFARSALRPRAAQYLRAGHSFSRQWRRAISVTAMRLDDGEFMNKEKLQSMIPEDALDGIDTEVPVIVEGEKHYSAKVTQLADDILSLNLLETADLCDILKDRLNMTDDAMFFPMPNLAGMVVAGGGPADGAAAEEAEPVEEKTHFDLKLVSFEAKSKIKIIKEVKAVTKLGLKEAKDLVEGAPAVLLKDATKEDAEPLKAALEELGAHVELE